MKYYSRSELVEILEVDNGFLIQLEQEEIITAEVDEQEPGRYSEVMLERVRVAFNLVNELEVNLPGVAIILRMREQMAHQRRRIDDFMLELERTKDP